MARRRKIEPAHIALVQAADSPVEDLAGELVEGAESPRVIKKLRVNSRSMGGRWRAGLHFGRVALEIERDSLTASQVEAIFSDAELEVEPFEVEI